MMPEPPDPATDSPSPSAADPLPADPLSADPLSADPIAGVRRATRSDNALLVSLMGHVPMEGSLAVATQRGPDFFALLDMQRSAHEVLAYDDGVTRAMGVALVRSGWLDGVAQPVGYLGDLRVEGTGRARRAFPLVYNRFFADVSAQHGCDSYLTAVLASNALAVQSLARRSKRRAAQPYYHLLRRYEMASIQMLRRRAPRTPSGLVVRAATPEDVPALVAFLHGDHRARPFGYRFDDGELEHRLARWPGFTLEDTLVARAEADGRIVGCTTLWDASPVKRYRVMRYGRDMKILKWCISAASLVLGGPRMPDEGEDFRSLYLTGLSVEDDSPTVLRALLEHAHEVGWRRRVHMISLPLYETDAGGADPLAPALQGFTVQRLPFLMYAVTSSARARTAWQAGRPGFEMALA